MSYADKLKDPRWQKVRLEVMARDAWTCQVCGDQTATLAVHHRGYYRDTEPWEYPLHALVTLCEFCHRVETYERQEAEADLLETLKRIGLYTHQVKALAVTLEWTYSWIHNHQRESPLGEVAVMRDFVDDEARLAFELTQLGRLLERKDHQGPERHTRRHEYLSRLFQQLEARMATLQPERVNRYRHPPQSAAAPPDQS
jgi:hypothetical protein